MGEHMSNDQLNLHKGSSERSTSSLEIAAFVGSHEAYIQLFNELNSILDDVQHYSSLNKNRLFLLADQILTTDQHPYLMNAVLAHYAHDELVAHSLNVALLSVMVGRSLNLPVSHLHDLAVGCLIHDIGVLFSKHYKSYDPRDLSQEVELKNRDHLALGRDFLLPYQLPENAMSVLAEHHEYMDGSGFPLNLSSSAISLFGKISSLTNCFFRIASFGEDHETDHVVEAVKYIVSASPKYFDDDLVKKLLGTIGLYPVGTLVLLSSGELAVVYQQNYGAPSSPKVLIISDMEKKMVLPHVMDILYQPNKNFVDSIRILYPVCSFTCGLKPHQILKSFFSDS